jgi:hypothetical protein
VKLPSSELITAEQAIKTILIDQAKIAGLADNSPSQIALPPKYFDLTAPIE